MKSHSISVSPALGSDVTSIAALDARTSFSGHWSEDGYRSLLDNQLGILLKAEKDGTLAGFIAGRVIPPEAELDNIAVDEMFRRLGIGSSLMGEFLSCVKAAGCKSVFLEVHEHNRTAADFYSRAGFKTTGLRPRFYEGRYAAVLMRFDYE